jgi:hypothetical protein
VPSRSLNAADDLHASLAQGNSVRGTRYTCLGTAVSGCPALLLLVFVAGIGADDLLSARQHGLDELSAAGAVPHRM